MVRPRPNLEAQCGGADCGVARGTPGGVKTSSSETLDRGVDVSRSTGGEIGAAPPLAVLVPQRRLNGVWVGCRFKKNKKIKKKKKKKKNYCVIQVKNH